MNQFDPLFTPFKIGDLEIKNRFVMCAMGGVRIYNMDGTPAEDAYEYYVRRAQGGVGLIITRALVVLPIGLKTKLYDNPGYFEPLAIMTERIHQYGSKVFLQLSGGAGRTLHKRVEEMEARGYSQEEAFFAPSDSVPNVWYPEIKHRGLTNCEIHEYINAFGRMAEIAKKIGFDGVEIHAIHEGYLLDQFTTACTNKRTDEYGGNVENRFRMVCEIIERIKESCGFNYPVSVRYSVTSKMKAFNDGALPDEVFTEYGRDFNEAIIGAQLMEKAGADMLDCDNGSYDAWYWPHPPVYMPNCCNLKESSALKQFVSIPIVCAGKMDLPEDALSAIETEKCDAIGLARAFLVDPDYVNKLQRNKKNLIKPCIGCHNGCLAQVAKGKALTCALNPMVLKERVYDNLIPGTKKKVAVIGAGIAGIEAALLLKEIGFGVTIYEKTERIGGNFRRAAMFSFKERDKLLLEWYEEELNRKRIPIQFNSPINEDNLQKVDADILIASPGAKDRPLIYGNRYNNTIRVEAYLENHDLVHQNVVIVGGGLTAIEAALEMNREGHNVIIVEMRDKILDNAMLCDANKMYLQQALKASSIHVFTSAAIEELRPDRIVLSNHGKQETITMKEYTVVEATGYEPEQTIIDGLKNSGKDVFVIGDAKTVGNVYTAVRDAYEIARILCEKKEEL